MTIVMRASYEEVEWPDETEDPTIRHGWTDPHNPYGGLKTDTTVLWGDTAGAVKDEAETVEFEDVWEAAEFILDFPGAVWDYSEGEPEYDYTTGIATSVTLHVEDDNQEFLFALADLVRNLRAQPKRSCNHDAAAIHNGVCECGRIMGEIRTEILAKNVQPGMLLDLQDDWIADPKSNEAAFRFEYQEVMDVTFETTECVVISGDGWMVGFPIRHVLVQIFEGVA